MATAGKEQKAPEKDEEKVKAILKPKGPTKSQLEKWISSLDVLLMDPQGITTFREFLKESEGDEDASTRYIDFVEEVQRYKSEFKRIKDKAEEIFETFLDVAADKEIATDKEGEKVGELLEEGDILQGESLFDASLKKAKQKLEDGQYQAFKLYLKDKYKL